MFRQVLVAVDGSHVSDGALAEALALVKDQDARLRIVHVIDPAPEAVGLFLPDLEAFADAARAQGHAVLVQAVTAARDAGVEAQSVLVEIGHCPCTRSSRIVSEAVDWGADLIVMGTHGRTGLTHLLMGSVAEGVVRIARAPVLLVRGMECADHPTAVAGAASA